LTAVSAALRWWTKAVKKGQKWIKIGRYEGFPQPLWNDDTPVRGKAKGFSMFRGNHPTRVDEKGRLKLPAEFKRVIEEKQYGDSFYITSRDGVDAEIHPMKEWEIIEQKIAAIPNSNPAKKKLMNYINYYGQASEMDTQGRVLLPQILREKTNTLGDVLVFGMHTFLKVTNREAFVKQIEEEPMTAEDEQMLESFGL
jgi:MraZ protein